MFWHRTLRPRLRQWAYAAEFRIPVDGPEDFSAMLLALLCEQERAAGSERSGAEADGLGSPARDAKGAAKGQPEAGRGAGAGRAVGSIPEAGAQAASDGRPADPPPPDDRLAIAICNGCFRIGRNAAEMAVAVPGNGTDDGKEADSIARALKKLREFLKQRGVEYRDLTGQVYDPGRQDFESIGEPEKVVGLKFPTIFQLERPAVLVKGKLVQTARGLVRKPAS